MNAAISGSAGVALLLDGERLYSIHADTPGERVVREPWEYDRLLGDVDDIELLENVDASEVERRLHAAVGCTHALRLALILLDGSASQPLRRRASAELEPLLAVPETKDYVQAVLYSLPLPAEAAVQSAQLLAEGTIARELLGGLVRAQPDIKAVRDEWEKNVAPSIEDPMAYQTVRAEAVKAGLFRLMAAFHNRDASFHSVEERAVGGAFSTIEGWQGLLKRWASPIEEQWEAANAMVARYWGYLEDLRSIRPRIREERGLPSLTWPKSSIDGESGPRNPVQREHDSAIDVVNDRLADSVSTLRRHRRVARSSKVALFTCALAVVAVLVAGIATWLIAQIVLDVLRWMATLAVIVGAAAVFWLLNLVLGSSRTWPHALLEYQAYQARREQFELEWARSLAPLSMRPLTSLEIGESSHDAARRLIEEVTSHATVAPRVGGVRLVISDLERLSERSFSMRVGEQLTRHVGTNSVALTMTPGPFEAILTASTPDGTEVRTQVAMRVEPDQIVETAVRFI